MMRMMKMMMMMMAVERKRTITIQVFFGHGYKRIRHRDVWNLDYRQ